MAAIDEEITAHPLKSFCEIARDIFTASPYCISKLTDTVKSEVIIGNKALSSVGHSRDYGLSVYHHSEEIPYNRDGENSDQGYMFFKGLAYIDFLRKINRKDANMWDGLILYSWTGLRELFKNADNFSGYGINSFAVSKFNMFIPEGQRLDEPVLAAVRSVAIEVYYQFAFEGY